MSRNWLTINIYKSTCPALFYAGVQKVYSINYYRAESFGIVNHLNSLITKVFQRWKKQRFNLLFHITESSRIIHELHVRKWHPTHPSQLTGGWKVLSIHCDIDLNPPVKQDNQLKYLLRWMCKSFYKQDRPTISTRNYAKCDFGFLKYVLNRKKVFWRNLECTYMHNVWPVIWK